MTEKRQQRITDVLNKRQNNITVILENVYDPHNISAVMRTADAIGCTEIYIVKTILPTHPKWGKKSSSGAIKWLKIHQFENTKECMDAVKAKYDKVYAAQLSDKAASMYDLDLTQSVALAFGNEAKGLTDEFLSYCDGDFLIPQMGMIQSLNISVACAITLYEAMRQKINARHYETPKLNAAERSGLIQFWDLEGEVE